MTVKQSKAAVAGEVTRCVRCLRALAMPESLVRKLSREPGSARPTSKAHQWDKQAKLTPVSTIYEDPVGVEQGRASWENAYHSHTSRPSQTSRVLGARHRCQPLLPDDLSLERAMSLSLDVLLMKRQHGCRTRPQSTFRLRIWSTQRLICN